MTSVLDLPRHGVRPGGAGVGSGGAAGGADGSARRADHALDDSFATRNSSELTGARSDSRLAPSTPATTAPLTRPADGAPRRSTASRRRSPRPGRVARAGRQALRASPGWRLPPPYGQPSRRLLSHS